MGRTREQEAGAVAGSVAPQRVPVRAAAATLGPTANRAADAARTPHHHGRSRQRPLPGAATCRRPPPAPRRRPRTVRVPTGSPPTRTGMTASTGSSPRPRTLRRSSGRCCGGRCTTRGHRGSSSRTPSLPPPPVVPCRHSSSAEGAHPRAGRHPRCGGRGPPRARRCCCRRSSKTRTWRSNRPSPGRRRRRKVTPATTLEKGIITSKRDACRQAKERARKAEVLLCER